MMLKRKSLSIVLALIIAQSFSNIASAESLTESRIEPHPASYGYFVDTWKNNSTTNMSPTTNPAIGLLSGYLKLWTPGTTWNNGTVISSVLNDNIQKSITITSNRTYSQEHQAYLDDRRNQNYSVTDGLGPYTDAFRSEAGAVTTIPDIIPNDATTVQYNDNGDSQGNWAETTSTLGNMVNLVNTIRNSSASTTPAKNYYQYPRPWRWNSQVSVLPTLIPEKSSTPATDGGFPSGHTNAATIAAIALAYAAPERYEQMLTRASELGNDRIVAGMHSPLDVIGGRIMGTAIAAAVLNDPANQSLKVAAYNDAHTKLLISQNATSVDRFSDYAANKKKYIDRLTYGFSQTGDTTKPMAVPKGAEVLLETRFPYLDSTQRRLVLYTTGLPSGYPLLDDVEGWGRLNLFAAADGFGALINNVDVTMDASKGGFNATDSWGNDIKGPGKLTKEGTGTLKLDGNNKYTGGTEIDQGDVEADSKTALGAGNVINNGGTLTKNSSGKLVLKNQYTQSQNSTLELNISSDKDLLKINGEAKLSGRLKLNFLNDYVPDDGSTIITSDQRNGEFSSITTTGLPSAYKVNVSYSGNIIILQIARN